MAAMTMADAMQPSRAKWADDGVVIRGFSGTGTDNTTIAAAPAAGSKIVIVDGRCSLGGASSMAILSGANTMDVLQFSLAATAIFPPGLELNAAEALILKKGDAVTTANGWIAWKVIAAGGSVKSLD